MKIQKNSLKSFTVDILVYDVQIFPSVNFQGDKSECSISLVLLTKSCVLFLKFLKPCGFIFPVSIFCPFGRSVNS